MDLSSDLFKSDILRMRDLFLKTSTLPHAVSEDLILAEFQKLLLYATSKSPWWKNYLKDLSDIGSYTSLPKILSDLPIMNPEFFAENSQSIFIPVPDARDAEYVTHTTRGLFHPPVSVKKYLTMAKMIYDAQTLVEWQWHERDIKKVIVYIRHGYPDQDLMEVGPPLTYLGTSGPAYLRNSRQHSPAELLDFMEDVQPAYLSLDPATLRELVVEQARVGYEIESLEQIFVTGAQLDDNSRLLAESLFGVNVIINRYEAQEFGHLATTCPGQQHLHTIASSIIFEILDDQDRPVLAPGQLGRVVVTDLHNYTSPLIRYEIGDVARWALPTGCGITWPAVSSQIERDDGWSQTENGEASGFSLFNVDFHNFRNLSDYQIIKFSDVLLFYYSAWPGLSSTQKNVIRENLKGLVSNVDEISFQPFSVAKPVPTGARLQVYQSPLPYREDWSQQELF